ncbi:hypothetical protein [Ammoniphilus sp. 3BR4]|uniref:hypothetical protein n=1 Tax=Ammoniphilus sp. 3BR4 TaxID=3158265 RepID=UPI0034674D7D
MKKLRYCALPLLVALMVSGCAPATESGQPTAPPSHDAESFKTLEKEQILSLMSEATAKDQAFYSVESHTTDEIYSHFDTHFTRNYIDSIILGGGNLKKENEKWVLAHIGGEFLEGTYWNEINPDLVKIETSSDGKTITVTNPVGDGLYALHQEIITIVYSDNTWKIDQLEWVKE